MFVNRPASLLRIAKKQININRYQIKDANNRLYIDILSILKLTRIFHFEVKKIFIVKV